MFDSSGINAATVFGYEPLHQGLTYLLEFTNDTFVYSKESDLTSDSDYSITLTNSPMPPFPKKGLMITSRLIDTGWHKASALYSVDYQGLNLVKSFYTSEGSKEYLHNEDWMFWTTSPIGGFGFTIQLKDFTSYKIFQEEKINNTTIYYNDIVSIRNITNGWNDYYLWVGDNPPTRIGPFVNVYNVDDSKTDTVEGYSNIHIEVDLRFNAYYSGDSQQGTLVVGEQSFQTLVLQGFQQNAKLGIAKYDNEWIATVTDGIRYEHFSSNPEISNHLDTLDRVSIVSLI